VAGFNHDVQRDAAGLRLHVVSCGRFPTLHHTHHHAAVCQKPPHGASCCRLRSVGLMFTLRDYQDRLVTSGEAAMLQGQRPCMVAPTGAGKTVIIAELARRSLARGEQVVIICHREEILGQIVASLQHHLGRQTVITQITAGSKPRLDRRVIVGMVGTMVRRLKMLEQLKGCTLLADECHHAPAATWRKVIEAAQPRRFGGLTATPVRPDGKGLGDEEIFDLLINGPEVAELMNAGKLCRYRLFAAPHRIDTTGMRKRGGDFTTSDMERRVVKIQGEIVRDWKELNPTAQRTISVAVSVPHAHEVAGQYRSEGIAAEAVDGDTPKAERRGIFKRFRDGHITVLCACSVIDEGLDIPEATCLQILRPTASIRLWRQLIGRVLRPAAGKDHALIIDHTDNWLRLPLPDEQIEWRLNSETQEPAEKRMRVINPDTGEVEKGELLLTEVSETGSRMVEITAEMLAHAHPVVARRLLNERCRAELEQGGPDLRRWLNYLDVLEDDTLQLLEPALQLPPGWAQGQMMVRMLLSPGQRLAATKRLQQAWNEA
jgi:superfamily II DNA or RNA helicase